MRTTGPLALPHGRFATPPRPGRPRTRQKGVAQNASQYAFFIPLPELDEPDESVPPFFAFSEDDDGLPIVLEPEAPEGDPVTPCALGVPMPVQIGRASCRERV